MLGESLALCCVEHDALQRLLSFGQRRCRLGRIGFGLARDPLVLGFQTIVLCGRLAALGVHELHENHLGGNEDKSPKQRVDEQIVAGQRVSEVQQHAGEGTRAETDHPAAHGVDIGVADSEAGEGDDDVPAVGANDDVQRVDGHGSDFPAIGESTEQNEAERGQKCHGDKCVHGYDALAAAYDKEHEQGAYQHGAQGVGQSRAPGEGDGQPVGIATEKAVDESQKCHADGAGGEESVVLDVAAGEGEEGTGPAVRPLRGVLGAQAGRPEEGELGHDERHADDVLRSGGQKRKQVNDADADKEGREHEQGSCHFVGAAQASQPVEHAQRQGQGAGNAEGESRGRKSLVGAVEQGERHGGSGGDDDAPHHDPLHGGSAQLAAGSREDEQRHDEERAGDEHGAVGEDAVVGGGVAAVARHDESCACADDACEHGPECLCAA